MTTKAKYGDTITVHFTCKLDDGAILDSSEEKVPIQITIGKSGYMKGFERAFIGMKPHEKKSVIVPADQAYGPYKDDFKQVISRSEFPGDIQPEVGMQIKVKQDNDEKVIRVIEVTESSVTMDANEPLAGKDLLFDIELVDILNEGPSARAYFQLGVVLQERGLFEEAIGHYRDAIETEQDFVDAYYNLGVVHHQQGLIDQAISYYQKILQLEANNIHAMINLGNALRLKGNIEDSISYFNKAIQLKPDYASLYNNLGAAFQDKGEFDEAIAHYRKALDLDSNAAETYNNLGMVLNKKGKLEESKEYFQKAIQLKPDFAEAHVNLSSAHLLSGNLTEGWKEYEWRLQIEPFQYHYQKFQHMRWDGSSLEGKNILVCSEPGVSDEIMFASCLPDIISQAEMCIVECDRRLLPIFSRSFPKAIFFDRNGSNVQYPQELSTVNMKTALGSLPKFYRPDLTSFPGAKSYLTPNPQLVKIWQDRFEQLGEALKVGISLREGRHIHIHSFRAVPLEQWGPLFSIQNIAFVNIQHDNISGEFEEIRNKFGTTIHMWDDTDPIKDLDFFAAQIASLDLVISLDSETVHLAGSLGKRVWTLLPFVPDWSWMLEREDSPWYPTMKLFRHSSPGDWDSMIKKVVEELKSFS